MVRCANCGFLCYRLEGSLSFEEADDGMRRHGKFATRTFEGQLAGELEASPRCFVRAFDLVAELKRKKLISRPDKLPSLMVIDEDRECGQFVPWEQGFTPKEHKEMMFDLQLRKFEADERDKDKKREAAREVREQWFQLLNTLLSGFLGLVLGLASSAIGAWLFGGKDSNISKDLEAITRTLEKLAEQRKL